MFLGPVYLSIKGSHENRVLDILYNPKYTERSLKVRVYRKHNLTLV